METVTQQEKWPCLFAKSNVSGETDFEQFFTASEILNFNRFNYLDIVKGNLDFDSDLFIKFKNEIKSYKNETLLNKQTIYTLFKLILPFFDHKDVGKYLDSKM